MELPDIFEEWLFVRKRRPRFHPIPDELAGQFRDQIDAFNSRIAEVRKQLLPSRSIDIYADFIDDGRCNAVTGIYNRYGLIGLNKGLILLPLDLFWRMFSHPAFLPNLGDTGEERRCAQHNDGIPIDYDELMAARTKQGRSPYATPPRNAHRRHIAELCVDLIRRFVAMHELVHILHGHVDYLQQTQSIPLMLESTPYGATPPVSRAEFDRQSMELWADWVAASVVLRGFLNKSPAVAAVLPHPRERLFFWCLSLYTLCRGWGFTMDLATLGRGTHPPSAIRFAFLMIGAVQDATTSVPELAGEYRTVVKDAMVEGENGIAFCGGERLTQKDRELLRDPCVMDYHRLLDSHMKNTLAAELTKCAYVALHKNVFPTEKRAWDRTEKRARGRITQQ